MINIKVNWREHVISLIIVIIQAIFATLNNFFYIQIILAIVNIILYRRYLKMIFEKMLNRINYKKRNRK